MKTPGLYVPLDVNYVTDEGIRRAGPAAELLFIRSLTYSKRTQSDGFLPDYDMPVISVGLPQVRESIGQLVEWELWLPTDGGWQIRSWQRWNETNSDAADKRKRAADRQRRSRERRTSQAADGTRESDTQSDRGTGGDSEPDAPDSEAPRRAPVTRDSRVTHAVVTPLKRREEKRREATTSRATGTASGPSCTPPSASRTTQTGDPDFDTFWTRYPRHKSKRDAIKAWASALKRGADPQHLIHAATVYAAARAGQDPQFTMLPATWLNKDAFDDEPEPRVATRTGTDGYGGPFQEPDQSDYLNQRGF
jgi:hypothetical protein